MSRKLPGGFALCQASTCWLRDKCLRFTTLPRHEHETYVLVWAPVAGQECELFIGDGGQQNSADDQSGDVSSE